MSIRLHPRRRGVRIGVSAAVAGLVLAGAGFVAAKDKALPPGAVKYARGQKFLVIVEKENGQFTKEAKAKSVSFVPLDETGEVTNRFRVVSTRLMQRDKDKNDPMKGRRLGVVLETDVVPASMDFEVNAGEIFITVDLDGNLATTNDQPTTDPVDIEPMPDPCPPLAPAAPQVGGGTKDPAKP